jgi:Winged helix DNA-binding domain
VAVSITWAQALAWRMERQLVDPIGQPSVPDVVRRLCGVQAQVASTAELAVRVRRASSTRGEVGRAMSDGRLIKTWAMRGALHLLTPEEGGIYLSLVAAGRSWELPSWQKYFGLTPRALELLRRAAREALENGPLTREELIEAVTATRGLRHMGEGLRSGWGTLLKPLAWQGDLVHGPIRGTRVTFTRPEHASSRWAGLPEPDEAAPKAIIGYLGAYGPASLEGFSNWLSRGRVSRRQLKGWFEGLRGLLAKVEVDGETAYVPAEHLDALASAKPSTTLRLLPGFDQWVLGPGTEDSRVIPAPRRWAVSKQSGWIAPIVVLGGVVRGTWELDADLIRVTWFREGGRVPRKALDAETERLGAILDRKLRAEVTVAR